MKHKQDERGFHLVVALLAVVVLGVLGFVGWRVIQNDDKQAESSEQSSNQPAVAEQVADITWSFEDEEWVASATPPACPNPLKLQTPADLSQVTGILYPGQYRGGDYKTHGGFRFDNSKNAEVKVTIPLDAKLISASRYTSSSNPGDPQYFLLFVAPCGIMYRLDHITAFTDKFKTLTEVLPQPKPDDSRTTDLNPPIAVTAGEVIGTAVGLSGNVFFDFGVNDLRQPNQISKNSDWAAKHQKAKHYDFYGVCWFDMLPPADAKIVKSLPAGGKEGKVSDYCK